MFNKLFNDVLPFCFTVKIMKEHDSYIALRLPAYMKAEIFRLVESGKFKNVSELVRVALKEFLSKNKSFDDLLKIEELIKAGKLDNIQSIVREMVKEFLAEGEKA